MLLNDSDVLESLDVASWNGSFPAETRARAAAAVESGKVLFAPRLRFELTPTEHALLSPVCLDPKFKNVSFRPDSGLLRGASTHGDTRESLLALMKRYFAFSSDLLKSLIPNYADHIRPGFTSFRPVEISGRGTSWRSDDTRLHVDAFPSRPLHGLRIFRIFSNVNPQSPRIWRVGEPFENTAAKFLPKIKPPLPGSATLLHYLRIVKEPRSEYDHFMLAIHDCMKADLTYQSQVPQAQLSWLPGVTWACFTDSVSHAAMSGQFALEQTFYLPVSGMLNPDRSPLRILERLTGRVLVKPARLAVAATGNTQ